MNLIETMKQALEVIEHPNDLGGFKRIEKVITNLRAAIAEMEKMEQKPVAWITKFDIASMRKGYCVTLPARAMWIEPNYHEDEVLYLYTHPAPAVSESVEPVAKPFDNWLLGDWFKAKTIDDMEAFFLSRLSAIRLAARLHGYAIGLHGSCRRDFDLMAMPWRDGAADKDELAHAIANAACGIERDGPYQWEVKPQGRYAVSIPICWTDHKNPDFEGMLSVGHIDLSVIEGGKT